MSPHLSTDGLSSSLVNHGDTCSRRGALCSYSNLHGTSVEATNAILSQPTMDERQLRKQQIRPRFLDLAEFDDDVRDDGSLEPSSRRAALGSFTDWPPAATVVRKKPPNIASSSKPEHSKAVSQDAGGLSATVEDADDLRTSVRDALLPDAKERQAPLQAPTPAEPKTVRFSPEAADGDEGAVRESAVPKAKLDLSASIIGRIQERPVGERRTRFNGPSRPKPSGSRFVVRRRMDEDLQKHEEQRQQRLQAGTTPQGQEPGTGFPEVSHRDEIAPILPPSSGKARTLQHSEEIKSVEAPQRDILATRTALAESSSVSQAMKTSTHSATVAREVTSAADDEEWLDEGGRPMSAFRKSRLLRQGLRPPSVRAKGIRGSASGEESQQSHTFKPDVTRDPGGGADIDAITAVLADVSRENDQKLQQMSATEVSEELRSLESLFGKDVLDALRNRKSASNSEEKEHIAAGSSSPALRTESSQVPAASASQKEEEGGPLAIKRQYFPGEPEGPNPILEWMMPQPSSQQASTELRFDFAGKVIQRGVQTNETYLSGLHHHGDDQDAPGYTFSELFHLSQSAVAAQRQLALNVLGRICEQHPAFSNAREGVARTAFDLLNDKVLLLRARVISVSRWLLGDRHFTVRSAALRCLTSAIRSLPAGVSLPLGAEQELNFKHLCAKEENDLKHNGGGVDVSGVEAGIRENWADALLESNILGLFLDRTDSVITSSWEAELALELLLRIASCSASHARQLFEKDPTKMSSFVVHLGLKLAWPPVSVDAPLPGTAIGRSSALPSVLAVRLLHQGILSDRKIAEAIVLSGSVEHLLRFVVTPPWKVEEDWASNDEEGDAIFMVAYEIFEEVLHLFASLASYGFFASVVARTWNLWQECGSWAAAQLLDVANSQSSASNRAWTEEARMTAAQRIFEILAGWTYCAMDPHELMTAHDITWTQVRDWIEPIKDAAQQINSTAPAARASTKATAFAALSSYIDAWLGCAMSKEPKILPRYLASCKAIMGQCHRPIQQHFLQVLRLFSSAPTLAMALDEAEQACIACHRYLDSYKTLSRAEQMSLDQQETEAAQNEQSSAVMLQEGLTLITCGPLWQSFGSPESKASGRCVYRATFSNFVAASVAAQSETGTDGLLKLAAITRLDASHVGRVADIVLRAAETLAGAQTADILRPFLLECVAGANRMPSSDSLSTLEYRDGTSLSQVGSLFRSTRVAQTRKDSEKAPSNRDDSDNDADDDKDVDPITGSKLWKCPASGLPIRADWPLLALDDLLHSANTAVFNRPDNLESDWKPSELEMVRASLQLAVAVFSSLLREKGDGTDSTEGHYTAAKAMLSSLPSPEQILLGVMKVFMLEKDQPDTFTDKLAAGTTQQ